MPPIIKGFPEKKDLSQEGAKICIGTSPRLIWQRYNETIDLCEQAVIKMFDRVALAKFIRKQRNIKIPFEEASPYWQEYHLNQADAIIQFLRSGQ